MTGGTDQRERAGQPTGAARRADLAGRPLAGSVASGLVASICCGGSLLFASMGLGAGYSSLGLAGYVPQALAAGAASIVLINYLAYSRRARRMATADTVHRAMVISVAAGIAAMAATFVLLEWLNHAVVHPHSGHAFSASLIPGVANARLAYAGAAFAAIPCAWALPWRGRTQREHGISGLARGVVCVVAAIPLIGIGAIRDVHRADIHAGSHQAGEAHHSQTPPSGHSTAHLGDRC